MKNYNFSKDWDKPRNSYYLQLRKVVHIKKSESQNGMIQKRLALDSRSACKFMDRNETMSSLRENDTTHLEKTFWKADWPKINERNGDVGEKGWTGRFILVEKDEQELSTDRSQRLGREIWRHGKQMDWQYLIQY